MTLCPMNPKSVQPMSSAMISTTLGGDFAGSSAAWPAATEYTHKMPAAMTRAAPRRPGELQQHWRIVWTTGGNEDSSDIAGSFETRAGFVAGPNGQLAL